MFSNFLSAQNIGEMHNTVLSEYNRNYGFHDISNIQEMNKRLLSINKSLYPEIFKNVTDDDVNRFTILLYGTNNTANFDYNTQMKFLLTKAVEERHISENFKILILNLINDNADVATSISNVNEYLKGSKISILEQDLLSNFKMVLHSSDAFWTGYDNGVSNQSTARCNPRHQVHLADAYGGIMGGLAGSAIFPGVGSIFGGAIGSQGMSALFEHMQSENGGHCV